MREQSRTSERAFVLGLDGVPWRLIDRWSRSGELPNFSRLREEGAAGPLESTTPPTTPLAWPSIATGVWPDKHGIYGFQKLSSSYSHRMYTSRDLRQPPLWEQVAPAHVGNVPMTYPPTATDGTMVTGMMTPSTESEFTHPPSLAAEIREAIPGYRIGYDYPHYADRLDEFEAAIDEMLENRRSLLDLQRDRGDWRLFFFVFTAPDRYQHLIWDEEKVLSVYRRLDEIVGDLLEYTADRDATLYVVSDHGFGPVDHLVYVNRLLEEAGYLVRRSDGATRGALSTLGLSRDAVQRGLNRVGISDKMLVSRLPRPLIDSIAERLPGDHALYDVDYGETEAFVHDTGACWINDTHRFEEGIVPPTEIDRVKSELREVFETLSHEGRSILEVRDCADLFPTDDASPDLVVAGVDGYEVRTAVTEDVVTNSDATVASHRSTGIVLAHGPSVNAGAALRGARVVDIAPTILHELGRPVPSNIDGRVLFDVFHSAARPATERVERVDVSATDRRASVDEDFTGVEDRLRGLGYME